MTNKFIEQLNFRYATKAFDPSKKLTEEQLNVITEALRLSPSSYGLEPWTFFVVENQEVKDKIQAAAYNQMQVGSASQVIVITAKTNLNNEFVDKFTSDREKAAGMEAGSLHGYNNMIKGTLASMTPEAIIEWNKKQAYIALGFALAAAAVQGVDACPMEGFNAQTVSEILGLDEMNLTTAVILPIGFRSEEDTMSKMPKSRRPEHEVIKKI
jgi:nitroreductase / dihydropteridine reductase